MCFDLLFVYCFWLFLLLLANHNLACYFTKNDTKNTATIIKKTSKFNINKSKIGKNPMRITIGSSDDDEDVDDDERKDKRRFGGIIIDRLLEYSSQRFMGKLVFFMPNYCFNYQNNY